MEQDEIVHHRWEGLAVADLVFQEDDGVGIADGGFQQALGVGGEIGRDDLETRYVRVPGVVLAVLGGDAGGGAVGAAEDVGEPIWPPAM